MDEVTLTLHPILRACWMKKGQQRRIPAAGQQRWHHVFGAYNWLSDQIIWIDASRKNTAVFVRFLEHFMASVQTDKPIVIVLDNASYHHSAISEAALAALEESNVIVCWLPPYCSDLNPIERYWRHAKDLACANKLHVNMEASVQVFDRALHNQNIPSHPDRCLFQKTF